MRLRVGLLVGLAITLFAASALAEGRAVPHTGKVASIGRATHGSSPGYRQHGSWSQGRSPHFTFGSHGYWPYGGYSHFPNLARSPGWPGYGYGFPYSYAPQYEYSPYLYQYFYDLYYRESLRTKEEADRYEESFRRQNPGTVDAGGAPLSPHDVVVTVDGQQLAASPSGDPLVLGSGRHTLRISAKAAAPAEKGAPH